MPLIALSESSPDAVSAMNIQQLVGNAGDGRLLDNSDCQNELRRYLLVVDSEKLEEYANHCLEHSFTDSGFALQDIVNEMGRRLGFEVVNGRYRGKRNENGFDGIWKSEFVGSIVVETKTTAAYTISLETIAKYRDGLAEDGMIAKDSAILFAVGRQDTLALEQQIRGSKYAWTMRIVSIEALLKLIRVNIGSVGADVTVQIHQIFKPTEYTRIDPIVNVVFTATEDKDESADLEIESHDDDEENVEKISRKEARELQKRKRDQIARSFGEIKGVNFVKRKTALFSTPDNQSRIAIPVSKHYERGTQGYWYGYFHSQRKFLREAEDGYMIFGCMDRDEAFAIKFSEMEELRHKMNSTPKKGNREEYWHVILRDDRDDVQLYLPKDSGWISLEKYKIQLESTE